MVMSMVVFSFWKVSQYLKLIIFLKHRGSMVNILC